jgi:hypothetical protein
MFFNTNNKIKNSEDRRLCELARPNFHDQREMKMEVLGVVKQSRVFTTHSWIAALRSQGRLADEKNSGAVAIITVIIVSIAALIMAVGASRMGLGDLLGAYVMQKGNETYSIAEGCAEEALQQLRVNSGYTGPGSVLALGSGECTIVVTGVGSNRTINIVGRIPSVVETGYLYVRSFTLNVTLSDTDIVVDSWVEKP